MRWNSPESRTRRSTAVTRCVPRLVPATAWISSRITVARPPSIERPPCEESRRFRLSGVVMRISGGRLTMRRRSDCGVSPLRVCTRSAGNGSPAAAKMPAISRRGVTRFARTSLFSALSGDT